MLPHRTDVGDVSEIGGRSSAAAQQNPYLVQPGGSPWAENEYSYGVAMGSSYGSYGAHGLTPDVSSALALGDGGWRSGEGGGSARLQGGCGASDPQPRPAGGIDAHGGFGPASTGGFAGEPDGSYGAEGAEGASAYDAVPSIYLEVWLAGGEIVMRRQFMHGLDEIAEVTIQHLRKWLQPSVESLGANFFKLFWNDRVLEPDLLLHDLWTEAGTAVLALSLVMVLVCPECLADAPCRHGLRCNRGRRCNYCHCHLAGEKPVTPPPRHSHHHRRSGARANLSGFRTS